MTDQPKEPREAEEDEEHEGPETGPKPEHPIPNEPHPSKGAGRMGNVQQTPEDQRAGPDPKRYD